MDSLERLRRRIDAIDERLVRLLEERAAAAGKIGALKRESGRKSFDPGREREVFERLRRLARGRFPRPALEAIFREIVSASRALGEPTRVAYLGREGSLAHWAALRRFGSSSSFTGFESGEALLAAVEGGAQEYALVSLEGLGEDPGFDAFDVLLSSRARVFGEFHLEGGVALLGPTRPRAAGRAGRRQPPGRRARLHAHPGLLGQCARWLESDPPRWDVVVAATSQEAARRAARERAFCLGTPALLGSRQRPGLALLDDQVADRPRQRRRFLILSLADAPKSARDKTAFLAVLPHRPGRLHGVLGVFARRDLNLVWIETRMSQDRAWQHVFLFEIEGHAQDRPVAEALEEIQGLVDFYKGLGSFPADPS